MSDKSILNNTNRIIKLRSTKPGNTSTEGLILTPRQVTRISARKWTALKKNPMTSHMLDAKLIEEIADISKLEPLLEEGSASDNDADD